MPFLSEKSVLVIRGTNYFREKKGAAEDAKYYLALKQVDGRIVFERIPIRFWGNMKEEYEAHNPDYTGVYRPEK